MRTRGSLLWMLPIALALAHCGPPAASCTQSQAMSGVTAMVCVEATELTSELETAFRQQCMAFGGNADAGIAPASYANGPCTRANALGGCRRTFGSAATGMFTQTSWYYVTPGLTRETVQMLCDRSSSQFVAP